jgi:hypothetical protein
MKRTPLIFVATCVVSVAPSAPSQAKQQCSAEAPASLQAHWYYRIIDDRKCWYQGKPMLSRSLLEWPARTPAAAVPDQTQKLPSASTATSEPKQADGFEARWRDRFLDAMGKY